MVKLENKVRKIRLQSLTELLLVIVLLVIVNVIAQYTYTRIDLTEDRRFSLGEPTKEMLQNLDDVVYFRVYIEGELPSGFRRLQGSIRDLLREFKSYGGDNIQFRFIDPNDFDDEQTRRNVHEQLQTLGLFPVNLEVRDERGSKQQIIFPGAIVSYKNREVSAQLVQSQMGRPSEEVIHSSVVALEYELANAIRMAKQIDRKKVAIIEGHGQLSAEYTASIERSLSEYYEVERINLPRFRVGKLEQFDVAIIPRPTRHMSEIEKYKIDQFAMSGGSILWLVDKLAISMDSLDRSGIGYTADYDLNLEDQLFNYGVRINYNLIQDLHSHRIPLMRSMGRGQPARDLRPWPYYPLVLSTSDHPVVNNLNAILFRYASTIDTVGDENLHKEVLLKSSPYSRVMPHPVRLNLQMVSQEPDHNLYNHGRQPVAVLVEGTFNSLFKGRLTDHTLESGEYGEFREKSEPTSMIFVSDGYVIKNELTGPDRRPLPLGYDRFTNQTFGNKNFILNAIDYLADDSGLIALRGKDYQLRLLDRSRASSEKFKWQYINMILPVLIVILFGIIYNYIRKRRYAV